jgi:hypothetical protein
LVFPKLYGQGESEMAPGRAFGFQHEIWKQGMYLFERQEIFHVQASVPQYGLLLDVKWNEIMIFYYSRYEFFSPTFSFISLVGKSK